MKIYTIEVKIGPNFIPLGAWTSLEDAQRAWGNIYVCWQARIVDERGNVIKETT